MGVVIPKVPSHGPFQGAFIGQRQKSVSPLLPVLRNPTALHFQRPEQFACDVLHGARCLRGTILPRWTVGQRAAHSQAGKAFELQPSSRDMRKPLPSRKRWSALCVMARTQTGTAHLQHRAQDSSHEIPAEKEGNGDRRCIHTCLSWQVNFQNNTITHATKKKKKSRINLPMSQKLREPSCLKISYLTFII